MYLLINRSCLSLANFTNDPSRSCIRCACSCTVHEETCFTLNIVSCYHHLCLSVLNTNEIRYASYCLLGDLLGGLAGGHLRVMPQSLPMILRSPAFVATAPALSHFVCMGQSVLPLPPVYQRRLNPLAAPIHLVYNPLPHVRC